MSYDRLHLATDILLIWFHSQKQEECKIINAPIPQCIEIDRICMTFADSGTAKFLISMRNTQRISRSVTLSTMPEISGQIGTASNDRIRNSYGLGSPQVS